MMSSKSACVWVVSACAWLAAAVPRTPQGELSLFAPASYDLESTVLLNDVARDDKEVGYKILATLDVAPVWSHQQSEFILKFQLRSPKLHLRGKHRLADFMPYDSVWDSYPDSTFYAYWKNGLIQETYLDPEELVDVVNYKKSLASLFQFQMLDGEYNETDVSGPCSVLYETISVNVFRKIKMRCSAGGGAVAAARRVARYTLSAALDALDALYADELLALGDAELGVKARALTRLARRAAAAPAPARLSATDARAALQQLPAALRPQPLELAPPAAADDDEQLDDEELVSALATMGSALEEGAGRDAADAAAALLRALPGLRAAPRDRLAALLRRDHLHPHLAALCRALGLAGTRAAHSALRDFAALDSRDPLLPLAHDYLAALALAHRPDEWVVLEVLRLGEETRVAELGESALLAAAAAAAAEPALSQAVRDSLARSLARCKDERCRAVRLAALGNLRRADTADLLLEHAARGGAAALAAVDALGAAPPPALTFARLERLEALALDARAPLELRGAALELLVARRAALPAPLARVAHALYARGEHELQRVLWQRVAALAPQHDELRRLPSMLEPVLRGWDAMAPNGTSSVLVRATGWAGAGWRAALDSVQLARAGLLRRGAVTLRAERDEHEHAHEHEHDALDVLSVRVWTRGLEAFSGGADEPAADAEPEDAAGGLALSVAGARMRDISLFNGQAELLGHVWAGTASAPTGVLRALVPLAPRRAAVPLGAGAVLHVRGAAALALALDASAQVSLWYRSARAELDLRAAALLTVRAALRPAWGALSAEAEARAAPRLRIGADLDFYSGVALCVRARTDAHERRRTVTLLAEQAERRLRVRRQRVTALRAAGRTLALGRPNDVTCRTLRAADDQED